MIGNSDRSTIVVNWFAPPFAARYVRVVPKTYTGAVCMRMDLFGCKNCKYNLLEGEFLNFDLMAYVLAYRAKATNDLKFLTITRLDA